MIVNVLTDGITTVEIIQDNLPNVVEVFESATPNVVEIVTAGPQGPVGPIGPVGPYPQTGSFATTGSNTFKANQIISGSLLTTGGISGSFSGSGADLFNIPASAVVGLSLSQISSGSVSASISPNSGLEINTDVTAPSFTGSLQGTSSWAISSSRAISSSYALSSSYTLSSSYATNAATASNILGGKAPHIPFFITDTTLATSSIYQSGSTSVIINQDNNTEANPEALYVWQPHPTSINVISGKGNLNNYLQLNINNTNQGTNASSDIVATANNGDETTNYIDMGINSENYTSGFIGDANDAYLYSTGLHLHIGNASNEPVMLFAGGTDVDVHNKLILSPNNQHQMTGSLEISGGLKVNQGITGSLFGTSSWAVSASWAPFQESSSYALTASYALSASYSISSSQTVSASYALTSSQAVNALTASYAANYVLTAATASMLSPYVLTSSTSSMTVLSASYSRTSSYAASSSYSNNSDHSNTSTSASHALLADDATVANYANTAGNGGVTNIVAGNGINLPFGGTGTVTIIAAAGTGEVLVISGSNVTQSFADTNTWTFNHNLGVRTPIIEVFDTNYNQVIPQNIQLVSTSSATITFPTLESGFAVASVGGVTGNAVSSSYSLFSTYAASASYFVETDPIFVSKSGSLATTGSNRFVGNQIITGSLIVSSSNTIVVIGPMIITGSLLVSGSTTQIGDNTLTGNTSLTGSITVSGSQVFKGDFDLTGSFTVTGSTVQIGDNTLTGNTSLTGSITVSGSQTFIGNNSLTGSFSVTGSTLQTGNNTLIGNTVLSGSLEVSGSQTFRGTNTLVGNTTISGSFSVSGSTTNNIIGNTEVYGQFNVSGSSNFRNSTFTVTGSQYFTGSSFINGNQTLTGNQMISGTLDVLGNINVISGSAFTRWGNKLFNYGAFSDYTTQSGSADTVHAVKFNTTDVSLEVYLSGSSAIKIQNKGIYNFQWSGQLHQGANASVVSVWLRINGTDVPGSRGDVTLASNDDALPSWNYVLPFNANDAVELYWSSTSANTTWVFSPVATAPPRPSTASLIATLTQIA